MTPLDRLIQQERSEARPAPGERERVLRLLGAKAGLAVAGGSVATLASSVARAGGLGALKLGLKGWGIALVATLAASAMVGWHGSQTRAATSVVSATKPVVPSLPGGGVLTQAASLPTIPKEPPSSAPLESSRTRSRQAQTTPRSGPSLARDLARLRQATTALNDNAPDRALSVLAARDAGRASSLDPEFAVVRVLALCKAGQTAASNRLRAQFLNDQPTSPFRARLQQPCSAPQAQVK